MAITNCGVLRVGKKGHHVKVVIVVGIEDEEERIVALAVGRRHQHEQPMCFGGAALISARISSRGRHLAAILIVVYHSENKTLRSNP